MGVFHRERNLHDLTRRCERREQIEICCQRREGRSSIPLDMADSANKEQFVKEHELDGIDFDWEYPSAPNIPGIPPGRKEEGDNYLKFLRLVRDELPEDKTVSIAAPASYWYLKGSSSPRAGVAVGSVKLSGFPISCVLIFTQAFQSRKSARPWTTSFS